MDIKIPRVRFIRPQHVEHVAEGIIKTWLYVCFWISPFAVWKIYELIKPLIKGL